jgi:hypothetical protein
MPPKTPDSRLFAGELIAALEDIVRDAPADAKVLRAVLDELALRKDKPRNRRLRERILADLESLGINGKGPSRVPKAQGDTRSKRTSPKGASKAAGTTSTREPAVVGAERRQGRNWPPSFDSGEGVSVGTPRDIDPAWLSYAYTALRSVFSIEGELMATWGMTPLMPASMQEEVFRMWAEHVDGSTGDPRHSAARLVRDREALANERKAQEAMGRYKPKAGKGKRLAGPDGD